MERRSRDPACRHVSPTASPPPGSRSTIRVPRPRVRSLGLVVFAIVCGVGTIGFPTYVPINVLVLPLILVEPLPEPALHAAVFLALPRASLIVASMPRMVAPTQRTWVAIVVILLLIACRAGHLEPAGPARGRRRPRASRCSSTCATGSSATAGSRSCRPSGSPSPRCAPRAARCSPATSSSRPPREGRLDVAVVDVSGKGDAAATRALLLSGAFGGLITAVPPDEFLDAANAYLLGHRWDEGFATAVQLSLDLTSRPLRGLDRRPPAGRAPRGRQRPVVGPPERRSGPRADRGRRVRERARRDASRRRDRAVHRRAGRDRQA